SARPPVLMNGTASEATNNTFFIQLNPLFSCYCSLISVTYFSLLQGYMFDIYYTPFSAKWKVLFHLGRFILYSRRILSALRALNSEFVGLPFPVLTVSPNSSSMVSIFPLLHATSMAWRIARSTRLGVVWCFLAIVGYKILVMELSISISSTDRIMA